MDFSKYLFMSLVVVVSLLASVYSAPNYVRPKRSPQTSSTSNPWSMFSGSFAGSSAQAGSFGGGDKDGSGSAASSASQAQSISYGPNSGSFSSSEANAGSFSSPGGLSAFLGRFFGR